MSDNPMPSGKPRGELIGAGRQAELYAWENGRALKLYRAAPKRVAFREAAQQAAVEGLGLRVPRVWGVHQVDGSWGVVMDRIDAESFAAQVRRDGALLPRYLNETVELQLRIHACQVPELAGTKARLAQRIARAELLSAPRRQERLAALAAMPEGDRLSHGDFHPENILGVPGQAWVIDWADATVGDPAADACRSYLLLKLYAEPLAPVYLDAYCRAGGMTSARVLAWLPVLAAARLAEQIPEEIERLLAFAGG